MKRGIYEITTKSNNNDGHCAFCQFNFSRSFVGKGIGR